MILLMAKSLPGVLLHEKHNFNKYMYLEVQVLVNNLLISKI